jgi:hypothetical protein
MKLDKGMDLGKEDVIFGMASAIAEFLISPSAAISSSTGSLFFNA